MEIKKDWYVDNYNTSCIEHNRRAEYMLRIDYGGVLIPMCQECVDDLYNELKEHVSEEASKC